MYAHILTHKLHCILHFDRPTHTRAHTHKLHGVLCFDGPTQGGGVTLLIHNYFNIIDSK